MIMLRKKELILFGHFKTFAEVVIAFSLVNMKMKKI